MNFTITNNKDNSIKVNLEFEVFDWDELKMVMEKIDNYFGE